MPVKTFVWNPLTDNVVKEKDGAGQTTAVYTHEPGKFGKLISQRRNGQSYQYHYDGQGSTRQLTDESQNVTDEYTYTAFGETVVESGTTWNPYRYMGSVGYSSNDSHPISIRARLMLPRTGRWMSVDPMLLDFDDRSFDLIRQWEPALALHTPPAALISAFATYAYCAARAHPHACRQSSPRKHRSTHYMRGRNPFMNGETFARKDYHDLQLRISHHGACTNGCVIPP